MNDYILLMHDDAGPTSDADWDLYFAKLRASGRFSGGSSIGAGECVRKTQPTRNIASHLTGYLRVEAGSLAEARTFLEGNPVFEAGGTVEIRELPRG
jgi:hypothetical protein